MFKGNLSAAAPLLLLVSLASSASIGSEIAATHWFDVNVTVTKQTTNIDEYHGKFVQSESVVRTSIIGGGAKQSLKYTPIMHRYLSDNLTETGMMAYVTSMDKLSLRYASGKCGSLDIETKWTDKSQNITFFTTKNCELTLSIKKQNNHKIIAGGSR